MGCWVRWTLFGGHRSLTDKIDSANRTTLRASVRVDFSRLVHFPFPASLTYNPRTTPDPARPQYVHINAHIYDYKCRQWALFSRFRGNLKCLRTNSDSDSQVPRGEAPLCFVPSPSASGLESHLNREEIMMSPERAHEQTPRILDIPSFTT
jgi:hypothetical protein